MTEDYNRSSQEKEGEIYLQKHDIFDLFKSLTESLAIEKPQDPIGFLMKKLTQNQSKKNFLTKSKAFSYDRHPRIRF